MGEFSSSVVVGKANILRKVGAVSVQIDIIASVSTSARVDGKHNLIARPSGSRTIYDV
jgi:hypothetical protein